MFTLKLFVAVGIECLEVFRTFKVGTFLRNTISKLIVNLVQFCLVVQGSIFLIYEHATCIIRAVCADVNILS